MQSPDSSPGEIIQFLSSLGTHGFAVGVDQLIAVQQLLVELAIRGEIPLNQHEVTGLLAPIVCRSPEEQRWFHSLFDDWIRLNSTETRTQLEIETEASAVKGRPNEGLPLPARKSPTWYWTVALLCVLSTSAVILGLWRWWPRSPPIASSNDGRQSVIGKVKNEQQDQVIKGAKVSARKAPADETQRPNANQPILASVVTGDDGSYRLPLLDSDFPVTVEVEYSGYVPASRRVDIAGTVTEVNFLLIQSPPHWWWRITAIVAALVLLIIAITLLLRTRQLHLRKWRTANRLQIDRLVVKSAAEWLPQLWSLRSSAQNLRRRAETGLGNIDVDETIKATIQSGIFTPAYEGDKSAPEYLVLINRTSAEDQLAYFADELVRQLIRNGVYVDKYSYDKDPRLCWTADRPVRSFTLDELSTTHPNHNLLIFDDGLGLFDPLSGRLTQSFSAFGERRIRALLTNDFPLDQYKHHSLSEADMLVMPVTANGIAGLAEIASGGRWRAQSVSADLAFLPPFLRERPARWIEELAPRPAQLDQLISELKSSLGNNNYLWLASCAVYPRLNWDLVLYLGYALLVSDEVAINLPQILRLPWFREGTMPDWLRERLISDLPKREELLIRESLYHLLRSSLDNDDGFLLEISRRLRLGEQGFSYASWQNIRDSLLSWTDRLFVRDFLRSEPVGSQMHDHVFRSFMFATGSSKLVFRIPRDLHDAFIQSDPNRQLTLVLYLIMSTLFVSEFAMSVYAGSLFAALGTLIVAFLFFYGDRQNTFSETRIVGDETRFAKPNFRRISASQSRSAEHRTQHPPYDWFGLVKTLSFENGIALSSYPLISIIFGTELVVAIYRESVLEALIIAFVAALFIIGVRQITNPDSTVEALTAQLETDEVLSDRTLLEWWLKVRGRLKPQRLDVEIELSGRSIVVGTLVALVIGLTYPYCVLKLGFGPNLSVISGLAGFVVLVPLVRILGLTNTNPRENNIVQTMGTSAGQTAFMAVLLAAFDMLNTRGVFNPPIQLGTWQIFFWLCSASLLGILLAVPMRRHYIDEENLTYADGLAAGETIRVLHEGRDSGVLAGSVKGLAVGTLASALVMASTTLKWVRESWYFRGMEPMQVGFNISLLGFGSGLLVGFRICLAMGLGTVISWVILPPFLMKRGMITALDFASTLRWVMWPATGLMVAGGLTSLALKWNLIVKTFRGLKDSKMERNDFPMQYVVIGSIVLTVVVCFVQYFSMGIPVWLSFIAIVLSLPLMMVGLRVLGETNWGPISSMSNMMQAIFAFISPGNVPVNMSSSGLTGTIAVTSEALMQDYKAGQLLKSNPRSLTIAQLIAAPVGSIATAVVYPILRSKFGIGDNGLSAPISVKWAGFAELLTKGLAALPRAYLIGLAIGAGVAVVLTLLAEKWKKMTPSPVAIGLGMLITPAVIGTFVLGGVAQLIWTKFSPQTEKDFRVPLASGFIAGEAILAVVLAILAAVGVNF